MTRSAARERGGVTLLVAARAAISTAAILLLVAGVPWALVVFLGPPLPGWLPGLSEIADNPITFSVLIKGLAIIIWLSWALLVRSFALEALALVRGRAGPRHSSLPGVQAIVRKLVASAALVTTIHVSHVTGAGARPADKGSSEQPATLVIDTPAPAFDDQFDWSASMRAGSDSGTKSGVTTRDVVIAAITRAVELVLEAGVSRARRLSPKLRAATIQRHRMGQERRRAQSPLRADPPPNRPPDQPSTDTLRPVTRAPRLAALLAAVDPEPPPERDDQRA